MKGLSSAAVVFILIFFVVMLIPCVGVAWLGSKLINKLGRYPSKTPALQISIIFRLAVLEVVSFTLLLVFFKILVAE